MALSREKKEQQVLDLTDKMKNASSVVFTNYLGLSVADITTLRSNLKKEDAEMKVAKKTLVRLAAKNVGTDISEDHLSADVACIFSFKEPTAGASVAHKFSKDHPQVKFLSGIFSGTILSQAETVALATIPSRTQLLGMFLSVVQSPLTKFVGMCNSPLTGFARALSEVAKKKESSPA